MSLLVYNNVVDCAPKYKNENPISIPYYSFSRNRLVICPKSSYVKATKKTREISNKNLKIEKLTGTISTATRTKLGKILDTWINSIDQYNEKSKNIYSKRVHLPVFITLTLSEKQKHSDNQIKRDMLGAFVKTIQRDHKNIYYFWRAESQQNGNIHFHIITDRYIHHKRIRDIWNRIQENKGYLDKYKKEHGHNSPNSTDVRTAANTKNFIEYVLKYSLKEEKNRKIKGRLWGLADGLREIKEHNDVIDNELSQEINNYLDQNPKAVFKSDFFTVIYFTPKKSRSRLYELLKSRANRHYLETYRELYNNSYRELKEEIVQETVKTRYITQIAMKFRDNGFE